jgi:hypothetical protein
MNPHLDPCALFVRFNDEVAYFVVTTHDEESAAVDLGPRVSLTFTDVLWAKCQSSAGNFDEAINGSRNYGGFYTNG